MNRKGTIALAVALTALIIAGGAVLLTRLRATPAAPVAAPEFTAEATQTVTPSAAPETTLAPTDAPTLAPTDAPELDIDPYAGELVKPTSEPGVAIPGWGSMTLPAGVTEAQTAMQNPPENEGLYYLTFELRLPTVDEATGQEGYEVLFTTGLIPPGQYCNKVLLSRALEPGEYAAVVHVQPYRMSDKSPTNNADMETVLIVK